MIPLVDSHKYMVGLAGVRCSQPPRHAMIAVVPITQGDEAPQDSLQADCAQPLSFQAELINTELPCTAATRFSERRSTRRSSLDEGKLAHLWLEGK